MNEDGISLEMTCRYCPLQFDGRVDGQPAYFRARYDGWTFTIARGENEDAAWPQHPDGPLLDVGGEYDDAEKSGYGAGYMEPEVAFGLIREAVKTWRHQPAPSAGIEGE